MRVLYALPCTLLIQLHMTQHVDNLSVYSIFTRALEKDTVYMYSISYVIADIGGPTRKDALFSHFFHKMVINSAL